MADKAAIDLGSKLHRLMENDDFSPFLAEFELRIANCKERLEGSGGAVDIPPHLSSNYAQRLNELVSLREWIDDEIERGGREKMKQQGEQEQVPE